MTNIQDDLITKTLKLNSNSLNILSKLTESLTTDQDFISVELYDENLNLVSYKIPSYLNLNKIIGDINANLDILNSVKNQVVNEPTLSNQKYFTEPYFNKPLSLAGVYSKRNDMLNNFTNINLFYELDLTNKINILNSEVKICKIILNNFDDTKRNLIDTQIMNKSNLNFEMVINFLNTEKIPYLIEEYVEKLEPITINKSGFFIVTNVKESQTISNSKFIEVSLDTSVYSDYNAVTNNIPNPKELAIGDVLFSTTEDFVYYTIHSIKKDVETNKNIYVLLASNENKILANSVLKISSQLSPQRKISIACNNPFEKHIIFLKQITPNLRITSHRYGDGIGVDVCKLNINLDDGTTTNIVDFYLNKVYDYSEFFQSMEKEMKITALYAVQPNPPQLQTSNFTVALINNHKLKNDNISNTQIQQQLANLSYFVSKKKLLTKSQTIQEAELSKLNALKTPITDSRYIQIQNNINSLKTEIGQLDIKINELNSILINQNETIDLNVFNPKYEIRGFWDFPIPQIDAKNRKQDIVKFDIQYRYLSLLEVPNCNVAINFTDMNEETKNAIFTDWIQISTTTRPKIWNEATSCYLWEYQDLDNTNVNINQLQIPITPNEKVEIRIRSISEAGFPEIETKSNWSNSIIIEFPTNLTQIDTNSVVENSLSQVKEDVAQNKIYQYIDSKLTELKEVINTNVVTSSRFTYTVEMKTNQGMTTIKMNPTAILINLTTGLILNSATDYSITSTGGFIKFQTGYYEVLQPNMDKFLILNLTS